MSNHTPERMGGMRSTAEVRRAYLALIFEHKAREAEHLADMLHCQERVVNLLAPARALIAWYDDPNRGPIITVAENLRASIAREEKEEQS